MGQWNQYKIDAQFYRLEQNSANETNRHKESVGYCTSFKSELSESRRVDVNSIAAQALVTAAVNRYTDVRQFTFAAYILHF